MRPALFALPQFKINNSKFKIISIGYVVFQDGLNEADKALKPLFRFLRLLVVVNGRDKADEGAIGTMLCQCIPE